MDIATLRVKTKTELQELLQETQAELRVLRFKVSENQLKDVRAVREARQTIAQIQTLLSANTTQNN
ncbi:MAG: 50S ribosomal protein L29 [Candidatus Magasanikbacteria bacterium RIFCSPHIGHO2_02_FULL_47_14]|uniref:Large ribosomal subunit protein uL29 n=1 Tax=Candidatus Magasanikbacteria bacterium RIFCSPHIGHO2_02_FULL_47_14 TaxID=1798680 RepID=A0A1F6LYV1_9BACT|nr:MAG: 50S ribosomal protein L29 [Candidatus Magasanikbacteria bacterium RIFCSPHIGHO2_02_FULL_47_14]